MKVKLNNVRIAFCDALFVAKQVQGQGDPAFSSSFLFPPDHPCVKDVNVAIDAVAREKWGAKATTILAQMRATDKVCLHSGDLKADYEGYAGNLFISARNKTRPLVIDRDKSPLTQDDGKPYGGCYVNASIELWAQDNQFGKRVNASLSGVQFDHDGDSFSGGRPADPDEFDDMSQGADAADLPV